MPVNFTETFAKRPFVFYRSSNCLMPKVKTVLVGDAGVGKTCIAERVSRDVFNDNTYATVGAANLSVTIATERAGEVCFNIWDTAGQEKYRSLAPMYFAGAHLAILVFDLTSRQSFDTLNEFYDILTQRAPEDCVYVLVGNKLDLVQEDSLSRQVTESQAQEYADKIGVTYYIETSARTGKNVKELFEKAANSGALHYEDESPGYVTEFTEESGEKKKKDCNC